MAAKDSPIPPEWTSPRSLFRTERSSASSPECVFEQKPLLTAWLQAGYLEFFGGIIGAESVLGSVQFLCAGTVAQLPENAR